MEKELHCKICNKYLGKLKFDDKEADVELEVKCNPICK